MRPMERILIIRWFVSFKGRPVDPARSSIAACSLHRRPPAVARTIPSGQRSRRPPSSERQYLEPSLDGSDVVAIMAGGVLDLIIDRVWSALVGRSVGHSSDDNQLQARSRTVVADRRRSTRQSGTVQEDHGGRLKPCLCPACKRWCPVDRSSMSPSSSYITALTTCLLSRTTWCLPWCSGWSTTALCIRLPGFESEHGYWTSAC